MWFVNQRVKLFFIFCGASPGEASGSEAKSRREAVWLRFNRSP
jgi:hypothetical protein